MLKKSIHSVLRRVFSRAHADHHDICAQLFLQLDAFEKKLSMIDLKIGRAYRQQELQGFANDLRDAVVTLSAIELSVRFAKSTVALDLDVTDLDGALVRAKASLVQMHDQCVECGSYMKHDIVNTIDLPKAWFQELLASPYDQIACALYEC